MANRSLLKDLHDGTDRWKVNVRVFRKWNVYQKNAPTDLFCVSTLLIDAEGNKIQASAINKSLHTRFLKDIKEGSTYFMANFVVTRNTGQYKPSTHPFKITITTCTHISEECHDIPLYSYSFIPIPEIIKYDQVQRADKLIDVIAFVRSMGTLEERGSGRDDSVKNILRMVLTDADENDVECVLFDQCATDAYLAQLDNNEAPVVVILHLAKIGFTVDGDSQVGNSFNATRVMFNPAIPEVFNYIESAKDLTSPVLEACSQVLPSQNTQFSSGSSLHRQPRIKISDISSQNSGDSFVISCLIVKLETRHGWNYIGCTKCGTKPKSENLDDSNANAECHRCHAKPHSIEPKLKLCYTVKDNSGNVCIVFWDKLAVQLVNKTASDLKLLLDKEDAAYDVPAALEDPVGKSLLVRLKLNDYNKRFPSASISVNQFTICEDLMPEFMEAAEVTPTDPIILINPSQGISRCSSLPTVESVDKLSDEEDVTITKLSQQVAAAPTKGKRKMNQKKAAEKETILPSRNPSSITEDKTLKTVKQEKI